MKKAFTMIELVFVIVILGILASVAVSKMAVTRDDAIITKGKSQVSAIRSAITLKRSQNMMRGMSNGGNPSRLDALDATTSNPGDNLFDYDTNSSTDSANNKNKLLDYPIRAVSATTAGWRKANANTYTFRATNIDVNFTYANGLFICTQGTDTPAKKLCTTLSN